MIWNSNLRFNLDEPVYKEAYDRLHTMDRKRYKSCNRVIARAVNEFFEREEKSERDPYFETREREEKFISDIVGAVGEAVREAMPAFMATFIMNNSWGIFHESATTSDTSDNTENFDEIDYTFAGE